MGSLHEGGITMAMEEVEDEDNRGAGGDPGLNKWREFQLGSPRLATLT